MLSSLILHLGENVDLKGKLAELRRWLEQSPLVLPYSVRENRITALFTSLAKKYARKDKCKYEAGNSKGVVFEIKRR